MIATTAPPALPTINHLLAWHWQHGSPDDVLLSVEVEHVDGQSTPDIDDVRHTRRSSRPSQRQRQYQDIAYREGLSAALLVASHLQQQHGIAKGSTVAIVSPNSPSMLVVMMALWLLDSIVAPLAHDAHADNLKAMLQVVKPDLVLGGDNATLDEVVSVALGHGGLGLSLAGTSSDEQVTELADRYFVEPKTQRQDTAVLLFTSSGISAKSLKCVETPHSLWAEGCHAMLQRTHPQATPQRCAGWAPFSHMMGLGAAFFADVLCTRGTYIFVPDEGGAPLPARLLKCIEKTQAVHSAVSPIFLDYFVEHADRNLLQGYTLAVGGAAPRESHWQWARQVGVNLIQAPGSTECGPWGTSVPPPGVQADDVPVDAVWVRRDLEAWLDGDGDEGELMLRGSNILSQYRGLKKAALHGQGEDVRTFRTGDVFRRHAASQGLVYECRLDDLIPLASGEKVPALDREERLSAHSGIVRACIVGDEVPREEHGFALVPSNKLYAVLQVGESIKSQQERKAVAEQAVRETNGHTEKQARVLLSDIIVLSPEEPLPLTRKGTLWRKKVWARFPALLREHLSSAKEPKLAAQLAGIFARHLALETTLLLSPATPTFEEAGASSLVMQAIAKEIAQETGHVLRLADLWSFATVTDLARALCVRPETAAAATTRKQQSKDDVPSVGVCGVALRLPGGIDTPADFWEALQGAPDVAPADDAEIAERWGKTSMDRPEVNEAARRARWLPTSSFTNFDHALFGITAEAALHVNLSTRLGLALTLEALENIGLKPEQCRNLVAGQNRGQCVGVWAAQSDSAGPRFRDYELRGMDGYDRYYPLGASESAMAGRISHSFGFHGPTVAVQAACASSLVAIHQASTALAAGDCDVAVVVSATTNVWPSELIYLQKSGLLAPNGQAHVLSHDADGFVPSEGAVAFVLARPDRLPTAPLASIVTSSVAHSGKGAAMAAPNGFAQEALLKASLAKSGKTVDDVDVHEAHATGTRAGDQIELDALEHVFAERCEKEAAPLLTGSAKERFGHLEETAGAVGLLKVILAMHHRQWPGMAYEVNRLASPANLKIAQAAVSLRSRVERRTLLGSVSSFGLTGTLAHVLVSGAPAPKQAVAPNAQQPSALLISARDEASLKEACAAWLRYATSPALPLASAALQTQLARVHYSHRRAIQASDWAGVREQLVASQAAKQPHSAAARRPVILFSGRSKATFDDCLAEIRRWQDCAPTAELVAFDRALIALVAAQGSLDATAASELWSLASCGDNSDAGREAIIVERRDGDRSISSNMAPGESVMLGDGQTVLTARPTATLRKPPTIEALREWEEKHGAATLKEGILSPWTGRQLKPGCPLSAGFWAKHLNGRACLPRLFEAEGGSGEEALVIDGSSGQRLRFDEESLLELLSLGERQPARLEEVLATLFEQGIDVDWAALASGQPAAPAAASFPLPLPNTPVVGHGPRLWTCSSIM